MSKAQHTPGPWHRNIAPANFYPTVWSGRNTHVAYVATEGLSVEQVEANINLIAAAPELLAACEEVAKGLEWCGAVETLVKRKAILEAAIAKARGTTP